MERNAVCKKFYVSQAGEKKKSPAPDTVAMIYEFATGNAHTMQLSDFSEPILFCATWMGLAQKFGDSYSGKNAAAAEEKYLEMLEALCGPNGSWLAERENAGPRATIIAEALVALKPGKYATVEIAQVEVSGWSKEIRAGKCAVPALARKIEEIKSARAQARLDKLDDDTAGEADL